MEQRNVYAVHKGRQTGLFFTWEECKKQVHEFEGARYKKFKNISVANEFVKTGILEKKEKKKKNKGPPEEERFFRVPSPWKLDETKENLVIYVDGSVMEPNGIPMGGYGIWFGIDDKRNVKEKFPLPNHTPNRCEIMASRRAIEIVNRGGYLDKDAELVIATDSLYVINAMKKKNRWLKNSGLLHSLYELTQTRIVSFLYVPAHSGIVGNEGADQLAKQGTAEELS